MPRIFYRLLSTIKTTCPTSSKCKTCNCTLKERIEKAGGYVPTTFDEDFLQKTLKLLDKEKKNTDD